MCVTKVWKHCYFLPTLHAILHTNVLNYGRSDGAIYSVVKFNNCQKNVCFSYMEYPMGLFLLLDFTRNFKKMTVFKIQFVELRLLLEFSMS